MLSLTPLADQLGITAPALRLFLSILLGYPIAFVYRRFLREQNETSKHYFCFFTGLTLGYFNFQQSILHCLLTTVVTYCIMIFLRGRLALTLSWIWNLTYLCVGYYLTETEEYDILWTMPQCVLCLRMIGWSFDMYDSMAVSRGSKNAESHIETTPKLYQLLGYAFFPTSFLIGPQYPFARYLKFIKRNFIPGTDVSMDSRCIIYGALTCVTGVFYLALAQLIGAKYFSDTMLTSVEFGETSFIVRMCYLGMWGRFTLYRYIACWLLVEGACAIFGLTFTHRDQNGKTYWDGCNNVKLTTFELASKFTDYIASFNCNTNRWVGDYVYKRLKFLGNKLISQLVSLLFLAMWHGFHSGYYVTFALEFAVVFFERDITNMINKNVCLKRFLAKELPAKILTVLKHMYTFVFMGFCLIPFVLRVYSKYMLAFANVNYIGIIFIVWPLIRWIIKPLLKLLDRMLNLIDDGDDENTKSSVQHIIQQKSHESHVDKSETIGANKNTDTQTNTNTPLDNDEIKHKDNKMDTTISNLSNLETTKHINYPTTINYNIQLQQCSHQLLNNYSSLSNTQNRFIQPLESG